MEFQDRYINNLNINKSQYFHLLIIHLFCGRRNIKYRDIFKGDFEINVLNNFLFQLKKHGINHASFNEVLLTLQQNRVSKYFFEFFFCDKGIIQLNSDEGNKKINTIKELKDGIVLFRGYAMLCFGNIKFALKALSKEEMSKNDIKKVLMPFSEKESFIVEKIENRPNPIILTEKIAVNNLWMNSEVAKDKIKESKKDVINTKEMIEKYFPTVKNNTQAIDKILKCYNEGENRVKEVQCKARLNTEIYLTQDYMDVYIATSMRDDWEFKETNNFINKLLKHQEIKDLKLRYFNPTNSFATDRIDKGLIEGLILKRCKCTIYMVQGYDTMGKDSELATTLVQGKPVIAYIPHQQVRIRTREIKEYPLLYFSQMHHAYHLGGIYRIKECTDEIVPYGGIDTINELIDAITKYNHFSLKKRNISKISEKEKNIMTRNFLYYPFSDEEQKQFKGTHKGLFDDVCSIMAIAEKYNLNKRADLLKSKHPLGIQVNLKNGVANGLLVVRNISKCARILNKIILNDLQFNFNYKKRKLNTLLIENISKCVYRAITHDERLTNSFWNLYSIT